MRGFPLGCDSFITAVDARFPVGLDVVGWEPLAAGYHHLSLAQISTVIAIRMMNKAVAVSLIKVAPFLLRGTRGH
jgi:hypothetical protein